MNVEDLRRALRDDPFRPFRIRMRNGDTYEVPAIGEMALSPMNTEAVVNHGESQRRIDPREVVAIEPLET